jgi:hypothetical protein
MKKEDIGNLVIKKKQRETNLMESLEILAQLVCLHSKKLN